MSATDYLFTSESVTEGHPDKVADRISDSILDAIFEQGRGTPALLVAFAESCLKAHPAGTISAGQVAVVLDQIEAT